MRLGREPGTENGQKDKRGDARAVVVAPAAALHFRIATAADVAAVVALTEAAYRGDASRAGWTTEADLLDGQRTDAREVGGLIADPDARVLLAERDRDIVASCVIERQADAFTGAGYFGMFAVRPGLQHHGVGSAVLAEAERRVRRLWNRREVRMTVIDVRVELIRWYERHGYRRTGEHKPFPYGDARFGLPRRDDLRFAWLVKEL